MAIWVAFSLGLFWIMGLPWCSHTSLWVGNPKVGICRLRGKIMLYFSRHRPVIFRSCCTIMCSHQQCLRIPISPHLHQPLVSPTFLKSVPNLLESGKWHFILALICLSLKNDDVEHIFMYLLTICVSYLVKLSIRTFCPLLIGLFVFLLSCESLFFSSMKATFSKWL